MAPMMMACDSLGDSFECEKELSASIGTSSSMLRSRDASESKKKEKKRETSPMSSGATMMRESTSVSSGTAMRPAAVPAQASLAAIVMLQQFDGSFGPLTHELASALGTTLDKLTAFVQTRGLTQVVWAAALAIACLMVKFAKDKDEWEMIADKTTGFLNGEAARINEAKAFFAAL